MTTTMKRTNQIKIIAAALLLIVISFTAIGSNSKTDTGKGHTVINSEADESGMNIFSRIVSEVNRSLSNRGMIIRLSGINLPNHSN